MRILVDMESTANATYDPEYHNRLRARIWDALKDTEYDEHGSQTPGFTFSNPFPWGDITAGDERNLIISSATEEQLAYIAADLFDNPHIHAGTMPFKVNDIHELDPDVGAPGTEGVLETSTGVYAITPEQYLDEDTHDCKTFWRPKHGVEAFRDYIETQLQFKHDKFIPNGHPGPKDVDSPLFEDYELIKTFWINLEFSSGVSWDVQLSKWRFPYRVRDNHHRRHLNLALDVGIGGRTPLGLGFINKRLEDTQQEGENR